MSTTVKAPRSRGKLPPGPRGGLPELAEAGSSLFS